MSTPQLVIHIGAPKCGSSALQSALSIRPDLISENGTQFRYTATCFLGQRLAATRGRHLALLGAMSPFGYASWPSLGGEIPSPAVFRLLNNERRRGLQKGYVPIVSNEGWISKHHEFGRALAKWGNPNVEIVAYLRPPADWVNAAYWQWGVWHAGSLDTWLQKGALPYTFGNDLEAWSKIPGVRLCVARSKPDVLRRFYELYSVKLPNLKGQNVSSPPSLIGVLLRNKKLRPSGHRPEVEFVYQRWCPSVEENPLWAIQARHIHALRSVTASNLDALQRCLHAKQIEDVLQDHRWLQEKPYHRQIQTGVSNLQNRAMLRALYRSLLEGITKAAHFAKIARVDVPPLPNGHESLDTWDGVLVTMIQTLLKLDQKTRSFQANWRVLYSSETGSQRN